MFVIAPKRGAIKKLSSIHREGKKINLNFALWGEGSCFHGWGHNLLSNQRPSSPYPPHPQTIPLACLRSQGPHLKQRQDLLPPLQLQHLAPLPPLHLQQLAPLPPLHLQQLHLLLSIPQLPFHPLGEVQKIHAAGLLICVLTLSLPNLDSPFPFSTSNLDST